MFLLLCILLLLFSCAPFVAAYVPQLASNAHGLLAVITLLILFTGGCVVWRARRIIERAARSVSGSAEPGKCPVCGSDAGVVLCSACGILQPGAQKLPQTTSLRLPALVALRWPAMLAVLATVYVPGAYSVLKEAAREDEERLQRRRETAHEFATAWSDFRGPLIAFGVQCGPTAAKPSDACDALVRQIATGYARMSWYMPNKLADLRAHECRDSARAQAGQSTIASDVACRTLANGGAGATGPTGLSSSAFQNFMNAYARYRREAGSSGQTASIQALGAAAANFYWETRKLGCSLMFANLSGVAHEHQHGMSRFCSRYLLEHALHDPTWIDDQERLDWPGWFELEPSSASATHAPIEPPSPGAMRDPRAQAALNP